MVAYNSIKLDNHTLVPFLIFGGQCLVSAMLTYLLPETFNVDLPYIIDEASEGVNEEAKSRHVSSAWSG